MQLPFSLLIPEDHFLVSKSGEDHSQQVEMSLAHEAAAFGADSSFTAFIMSTKSYWGVTTILEQGQSNRHTTRITDRMCIVSIHTAAHPSHVSNLYDWRVRLRFVLPLPNFR